jgi:hypothetical protein
VLALALLSGSWSAGLALGLVFGGARALPALLLGRARTHDELRRLAGGLERYAPVAARATPALLTGGSVALLAGVLA